MKHIIADKLNFLMKVTGTKNNMLGRVLSFDASHISRIRSGQRGLPSHREFIVPAAGYFARAGDHGHPAECAGAAHLPRPEVAGHGGRRYAVDRRMAERGCADAGLRVPAPLPGRERRPGRRSYGGSSRCRRGYKVLYGQRGQAPVRHPFPYGPCGPAGAGYAAAALGRKFGVDL